MTEFHRWRGCKTSTPILCDGAVECLTLLYFCRSIGAVVRTTMYSPHPGLSVCLTVGLSVPFAQKGGTLPTLSLPWSISIHRTGFLNCIELANLLISGHWNCEGVGREEQERACSRGNTDRPMEAGMITVLHVLPGHPCLVTMLPL